MQLHQDNYLVDDSGKKIEAFNPYLKIPVKTLSLLVPILSATAIFMSSAYTLLFFSKIKISPLSIPLSLTDYIIAFGAWGYSALYLIFIYSISFLSILITENTIKKHKIGIIAVIFLLLISSSIIVFSFTNSIYSSLLIFIIGIILYFLSTKKLLGDISKSNSLFNPSMIVYVASLLIFFNAEIEYGITINLANKQKIEYRDKEIEASILRAFDKGILVHTISDQDGSGKKSYILFLPYDKGPVLTFPAPLREGPNSTTVHQRPKEELPDAG